MDKIKTYRKFLLHPWYGLTYQEQEEAHEQAYALGMAAARDRLERAKRPGAVKGPDRLAAARLYLRMAEAPRGFRATDWADDRRVAIDFQCGWWSFRKMFLELRDRDIVW